MLYSKIYHSILLLFIASLFSPKSHANVEPLVKPSKATLTAPHGTSGVWQVDQSGAATYRYQLDLPEGAAGLTPKVAITYSSDLGLSNMGYGFTLTNFAYIQNCPLHKATDGRSKYNTLDWPERFENIYCFDGQKLVRASKERFEENITYTKKFNGDRVVIGKRLEHIFVFTKNGEKHTYSLLENDRVTFYLRYIDDRHGNRITYNYHPASNAYVYDRLRYISNITYTSHPDSQAPAKYVIEFKYTDSSFITNFISRGGTPFERSTQANGVIVKRINPDGSSQKIKQWNMYYRSANHPDNARITLPYLTGIEECGLDSHCFQRETFTWQGIERSLKFHRRKLSDSDDPNFDLMSFGFSRSIVNDLNNDGYKDLVFTRYRSYFSDQKGLFVAYGHKDGFAPSQYIEGSKEHLSITKDRLYVLDQNADQYSDIVILSHESIHVYYGSATGFSEITKLADIDSQGISSHVDPIFIDANGDHSADLILCDIFGNLMVAPGTESGELKPFETLYINQDNFSGDPEYTSRNGFFLTHLNEDDQIDIVTMSHDTMRVYSGHSDDKSFMKFHMTHEGPANFTPGQSVSFMDINADGHVDIIKSYRGHSNDDTQPFSEQDEVYELSVNGSFGQFMYFEFSGTNSWNANAYNRYSFIDFDRDGKLDLFGLSDVFGPYVRYNISGRYFSHDISSIEVEGLHERDIGREMSGNFLATVDINNDGNLDFLYHQDTKGLFAYISEQTPKRVIASEATTGIQTKITYSSLSDEAIYKVTQDPKPPLKAFRSHRAVVERLEQFSPQGLVAGKTFFYQDLYTHMRGKGSLGFAKIIETDLITGYRFEQSFLQDYQNQMTGLVFLEKEYDKAGKLITKQEYSYAREPFALLDDVYLINLKTRSTTEYDSDGKVLKRATIQSQHDGFGHATAVTQTHSNADKTDHYIITTEVEYLNDTEQWLLGKPLKTLVTHERHGQKPLSLETHFRYDETTGDLLTTTQMPGTKHERKTYFVYDERGQKVEEIRKWHESQSTGLSFKQLRQTWRYNESGQLIEEQDALKRRVVHAYNSYGWLKNTTDVNSGRKVQYAYDDFGRVIQTVYPDGTVEDQVIALCGENCPEQAVFFLYQASSGRGFKHTYYDILGRKVATINPGKDRLIAQYWRYNKDGTLQQESLPFFHDEEPTWEHMSYDSRLRLTKKVHADKSSTILRYDGLTQIETNELGQYSVVRRNFLGQVVQTEDALGNTVDFSYSSFGRMLEVSRMNGTKDSFAYDIFGNLVSSDTEAEGQIDFVVNGLDLITQVQYATGHAVHTDFDALGRPLKRQLITSKQSQEHTWSYHNELFAESELSKVQGSDGYSAELAYNTNGQLIAKTFKISGIDKIFKQSLTLDSYNRVSSETTPSGAKVHYNYDENGSLLSMTDTGGRTLWENIAENPRSQSTHVQLNGNIQLEREYHKRFSSLAYIKAFHNSKVLVEQELDYDSLGNLISRNDLQQNKRESFGYDDLNRLTSASGDYGDFYVTYGAFGNILSRSDRGKMEYGGVCAGVQASVHAISKFTPHSGKAISYCYNKAGQMTRRGGDKISYNATGLVSAVESDKADVSFKYAPDGSRYLKTITKDGKTTKTVQLGKSFEHRIGPSGVTERSFLHGGVVHSIHKGEEDYKFLVHDHLGSVIGVITSSASLEEAISYDPWGQRRESLKSVYLQDTGFEIGFSNHEHLTEVGLIHMNGRVYDPLVGRFLSPDPLIQEPLASQSHNRYSYVWNNPLSYSDPTGHITLKMGGTVGKALGKAARWVKKNRAMIAGLVVSVYMGPLAAQVMSSFWAAVVTGATSGLISSGGDIEGAALGALSAGLFSGVGIAFETDFMREAFTGSSFYAAQTVAHGTVGGLLSLARGGKFEIGFLRSAIAKGFHVFGVEHDLFNVSAHPETFGEFAYSVAVSGAIGGASSELTGGVLRMDLLMRLLVRCLMGCIWCCH